MGWRRFFWRRLDERIKASAPVSGTLSTHGWVKQRLSFAHCDCQYPVNSYGLMYSEIGALTAPRKQLLVNADADRGFPMDAFNEMADKMQEIYRLYNAGGNLRTAVTQRRTLRHRRDPAPRLLLLPQRISGRRSPRSLLKAR